MTASRGAGRCGRKKDAMGMKLMKDEGLRTPSRRVNESASQQVSHVTTLFPPRRTKRMGHGLLDGIWQRRFLTQVAAGLLAMGLAAMAWAQGVSDDDRAGHGVSGERATGRGNTGDQLAGVYDRGGPGGGGGLIDGDDCGGRLCEREPRAEPGRDARGRVLHGRVLHERWDGEHAVLGGSGGGAGEPGAGAGAGDAGGAGGAGGEQGVRGPGDRGVDGRAC